MKIFIVSVDGAHLMAIIKGSPVYTIINDIKMKKDEILGDPSGN